MHQGYTNRSTAISLQTTSTSSYLCSLHKSVSSASFLTLLFTNSQHLKAIIVFIDDTFIAKVIDKRLPAAVHSFKLWVSTPAMTSQQPDPSVSPLNTDENNKLVNQELYCQLSQSPGCCMSTCYVAIDLTLLPIQSKPFRTAFENRKTSTTLKILSQGVTPYAEKHKSTLERTLYHECKAVTRNKDRSGSLLKGYLTNKQTTLKLSSMKAASGIHHVIVQQTFPRSYCSTWTYSIGSLAPSFRHFCSFIIAQSRTHLVVANVLTLISIILRRQTSHAR